MHKLNDKSSSLRIERATFDNSQDVASRPVTNNKVLRKVKSEIINTLPFRCSSPTDTLFCEENPTALLWKNFRKVHSASAPTINIPDSSPMLSKSLHSSPTNTVRSMTNLNYDWKGKRRPSMRALPQISPTIPEVTQVNYNLSNIDKEMNSQLLSNASRQPIPQCSSPRQKLKKLQPIKQNRHSEMATSVSQSNALQQESDPFSFYALHSKNTMVMLPPPPPSSPQLQPPVSLTSLESKGNHNLPLAPVPTRKVLFGNSVNHAVWTTSKAISKERTNNSNHASPDTVVASAINEVRIK